MKHSLYSLMLFTAIACKDNSPGQSTLAAGTTEHSVAILPMGNIDKQLVTQLRDTWQKKLNVPVTVMNDTALPATAFYKPRQRYIADSLLEFLARVNGGRCEKIIGITSKDISTRKGDIANWGVLGLGNCPGESCVISSFRAGKTRVKAVQFLQRMTNLGLHELGHTYGLEHCPVDSCLMVDAQGKMKLDNGNNYCNKCFAYLSAMGILK